VAGLRIAVSPNLGYVSVHPEVAAAFSAAVEVFGQLGAGLESVDPGFADPVEAFHVLWFAGAAKSVAQLDEAGHARLTRGSPSPWPPGAGSAPPTTSTPWACATSSASGWARSTGATPLLLTPTLPIPAFPGGLEVPATGWTPLPGADGRRWTSWTPFTYPFNMTQQPAASVPCGFTSDGLPIGLQIVGPRHADAAVLAAAHAFQQATDWHLRRPPLLG